MTAGCISPKTRSTGMKLSSLIQFLLLLIVGLPILALIVAIATIDRLIDRVPDITITWRK